MPGLAAMRTPGGLEFRGATLTGGLLHIRKAEKLNLGTESGLGNGIEPMRRAPLLLQLFALLTSAASSW